ncbi:MAG TPA: histidine triad nucleotide-binding protein [Verrucomicrobiae bacterium]|nr:histidine triad nucleotide-binding protein [Verrucomicrobiae bacterium]
MSDCLFCRIGKRELPAKIVFEDALSLAFDDITPQAPHHVLVIPRAHFATLDDVPASEAPLLGHLVTIAARIARERGLAADGYRLVANCRAGAGQSVFHVHLHLLGGRSFHWPPG